MDEDRRVFDDAFGTASRIFEELRKQDEPHFNELTQRALEEHLANMTPIEKGTYYHKQVELYHEAMDQVKVKKPSLSDKIIQEAKDQFKSTMPINASTITLNARDKMNSMINGIDGLDQIPVYGDTDSIFVAVR